MFKYDWKSWVRRHKGEIILAAIFAFIFAIPAAIFVAQLIEEKYFPPMGTLCVYSIPQDATVYVAPEGTLREENRDLEPKIGSEESKEGVTPISKKLKPLEIKLKPGYYDVQVEVTADQFSEFGIEGAKDFEGDDNFCISTRDIVETTGPDNITKKYIKYAKIYKVWVNEDIKTTLISLFQPKNVSYSDLLESSLYPKMRTFQFDDEELKKNLLSNNASHSDIPYMLELLHKGGKIVWREGKYRYVMERSVIESEKKYSVTWYTKTWELE